MKALSIFSAIILTTLLFACNNKEADKGIMYSNDDSELTMVMREMFDYYAGVKKDIQDGNVPKEFKTFEDIHTAVSTEPEKAQSDLYKAMAQVYADAANRLNDDNVDINKAYNEMVDHCMNCHKQMCPGPTVKIKKLYLAKK